MRKRIARILLAISDRAALLALRARRMQVIAGAEEEPPPAKTFTQEELDRIVSDRLARDRKDRKTDDEIAELERRAAKADELEAANLTAADRLKADAEKATAERDAANEAAATATAKAHDMLRRAQIISAAAKAGAVDSDAVYALLHAENFAVTKDGTKLEVTVGDDGQVTGHEEAVTAFLEAKQYLVGSTPTPGPGGGGPRPGPPASALTEEEKAAARMSGMTETEYAAYKDSPSALPEPVPATT